LDLNPKLSFLNPNSNYIRKNREITVDDVNERIEILENSGYLGTPGKGLNTFSNYYAFVYANGKVILERFWKDDEMKPALNEATYVLSIDNFKEMSKLSKTNLIEYIKLLPNKDVKRFYHTATDPNYPNREWKLKLHKEIVGTYRIEDAINFIDNIRNVGVTYEK